MRFRSSVMLAAVGALGFASASRANFITNGDFETGAIGPWVVVPGSSTDNIGVVPTGYYGSGNTATDGNDEVAFNMGGSSYDGYIYQSFTTTPNTVYTLSYLQGVANGGAGQTLGYDVYNGSGVSGASLISGTTFSNAGVNLATESGFTFTALSTTTTLQFLDEASNAGSGGSSDAILDNVDVELPEPASIGAIAVAALGLLARRRQSVC